MGAQNIKEIVSAAIQQKIKYLTLFAFSCEN
jgi:undecaprenyl pyrophosphate synthase